MLNKIKGAKIAPFFMHGLLVQEVSPIAMALDVPYIMRAFPPSLEVRW